MTTLSQPGLHEIREAVSRLRRRRISVRLLGAAARWVCVVLLSLLGLYVMDLLTGSGRIERGIVVLLWLAAMGWLAWRWIGIALRTHEDDTALALMIEQQQGIETDLVAALQFAEQDRTQWGSPSLRAAVVSYVDEVVPGLDLLEGFDRRALRRPLIQAGAALLIWLIVLLLSPSHFFAFGSRLFLSGVVYPTDTSIVAVLEPGPVIRAGDDARFTIRLDGELPRSATAHIRNANTGERTAVALVAAEDDASRYTGVLRAVHDPLQYRVEAGDARGPWTQLRVTPLPRLALTVHIQPPSYLPDAKPRSETDTTRIAAPQGSTLRITLKSDQPLQQPTVRFGETDHALKLTEHGYELQQPGPPLSPLEQTTTLTIAARDSFGLPLDNTPSSTVVMQPDDAPTVKASAVTRLVLPAATPTLDIEADDDVGLDQVALLYVVTPVDRPPFEQRVVVAEPNGAPSLKQRIAVPLAGLNLSEGARVEIIAEARDRRGNQDGATGRSTPVAFEVVDRGTLLDALLDAERQMDQKLQRIIDTQEQIGGQP